MPQLVGVSHHVDGCDLSVLDVERGRLKLAIGLERDETGQTVDETGTDKLRAALPKKICQKFVDLHDGIERAKALLRDTDAPIIEIAFQTGWNSLGTFGRVFRANLRRGWSIRHCRRCS
jgi:hypothetical protein